MYISVEFLSPYCILRADEYSEKKKGNEELKTRQ